MQNQHSFFYSESANTQRHIATPLSLRRAFTLCSINLLPLILAIETGTENYYAASNSEQMPTTLKPLLPIMMAFFAAIIIDLVLMRMEIKRNYEKPIVGNNNSLLSRSTINDTQLDIAEPSQSSWNDYKEIMGAGVKIVGGALLPLSAFYLNAFRMWALLRKERTFLINGAKYKFRVNGNAAVGASITSGALASIYTLFTSSAAAFHEAYETSVKHNIDCGGCGSCMKITAKPIGSLLGVPGVAKTFAILGAANASFLDATALFTLLESVGMNFYVNLVLSGYTFIIMADQSFSFLGREFCQYTLKLHHYLKQNGYEEIAESVLKKAGKAISNNARLLGGVIKLAIATTAAAANFSLAVFTLMAGMQGSYNEEESTSILDEEGLTPTQMAICITLALFYTYGEFLTETKSSWEKFDRQWEQFVNWLDNKLHSNSAEHALVTINTL